MDISIIIVNWNTADLTIQCLESLYQNPPQADFDVWLVDNASHDDSVVRIREHFPQVHLIESPENLGFGRANNLAIQQSSGRYVELLNSDTIVLPGAMQMLYNFMESHPEACASGSLYYNPDYSLQSSCAPFPTLLREFWRLLLLDSFMSVGTYNMRGWRQDQSRKVDILQGASLFLRRSALEQVGTFDPDYFMYTEEFDLCYRLAQAGWSLYWVPQSRIVHYGGQSTRQVATQMFLYLYLTKVMFFRKNYGPFAARTYKSILALTSLTRLVAAPILRLLKPSQRDKYQKISENYRLLLSRLPQM